MKNYLVIGLFFGVDELKEFILPERFFLTIVREEDPNQARIKAEDWLKKKLASFYGRFSNLIDCEAFADEIPASLSDENIRILKAYNGISKDLTEWWEIIREHLSAENLKRLSRRLAP